MNDSKLLIKGFESNDDFQMKIDANQRTVVSFNSNETNLKGHIMNRFKISRWTFESKQNTWENESPKTSNESIHRLYNDTLNRIKVLENKAWNNKKHLNSRVVL